jgi:hypothetical protein
MQTVPGLIAWVVGGSAWAGERREVPGNILKERVVRA